MSACAMKLAKGTETTVTQDFFKAFKENFKQATKIFFVLLPIAIVLIADIWFWNTVNTQMAKVMGILSLCLCVPYALILMYVFAMQAYFENTVKNTIINALLFAYRNPIQTLHNAVIIVLCVLLNCTIIYVNIFTLVFGLGWVGYLCSKAHVSVFYNHLERQRLKAQEEEGKQTLQEK
ncbi:MAG: DUF624 domain-containing protein, partial [Oscillospiraceae bacterium]|nr:DUF624 domain-containing protein [Oscillospiraceae bacterium]